MSLNNIKLSIGIMAVPQRKNNVDKILQKLNVPAEVFYDYNKLGTYQASKRVFTTLAQDESTTHILVLQDDVAVCENFIEIVYKVIGANPDVIINLYNPRFSSYDISDSPYFTFDLFTMFSGQAIIMPKQIAVRCFLWCDIHPDKRKSCLNADDSSIKIFASANNIPRVGTKVSLVQHLMLTNSKGILPISHKSRLFFDDFDNKDKINW